jgi:plastocyanin
MSTLLFRLLRPCLYLLVSAIFLGSCSSSPEKTEKTVPKVYTVEIANMEFKPAELTVHKGDTVIFLNKDMVVHDVTEDQSKAWSSSNLPPGQSYSLVITQSARYYCSIHPVMKGKIVVQE